MDEQSIYICSPWFKIPNIAVSFPSSPFVLPEIAFTLCSIKFAAITFNNHENFQSAALVLFQGKTNILAFKL